MTWPGASRAGAWMRRVTAPRGACRRTGDWATVAFAVTPGADRRGRRRAGVCAKLCAGLSGLCRGGGRCGGVHDAKPRSGCVTALRRIESSDGRAGLSRGLCTWGGSQWFGPEGSVDDPGRQAGGGRVGGLRAAISYRAAQLLALGSARGRSTRGSSAAGCFREYWRVYAVGHRPRVAGRSRPRGAARGRPQVRAQPSLRRVVVGAGQGLALPVRSHHGRGPPREGDHDPPLNHAETPGRHDPARCADHDRGADDLRPRAHA